MGHWLTVVFCLAWGFEIQQCVTPDVDQQGFIQTLLESYDNGASFPENFYTLLGLICPSSVYCQNDNNSYYGIDSLGLWDTDTMPDVANFSISFSNNQTGAIAEARKILKRNALKLKGFCTPCSCDDVCVERQNCCPAMANSFKEIHDVQPRRQITQECVIASIGSYLRTVSVFEASTVAAYFMVTDCFSAYANDNIAVKCRQPDPEQMKETRPVYSAYTKTIYKNEYCASCNDENQVTPWIAVITINERLSFTGQYKLASTPEEIYSDVIRHQRLYSMFYKPPANMIEDKQTLGCQFFIGELISDEACNANNFFDNEHKYFFQQTCKYRQLLYNAGAYGYENVFCFLCQQSIYGPKASEKGGPGFSFSAVLGDSRMGSIFQSNNGIDLDNDPCRCTEYLDDKKKRCRQMICAPGEVFVNCTCQSFLRDITHMPVKIFIEIIPERELLGSLAEQLLSYKPDKNVITATVNKLKKTIVSNFGPLKIESLYLFREITSSERVSFKLCSVIIATFTDISDDKEAIKILFKALHLGISVRFLGTPMVVTLGRIMSSSDLALARRDRFYNISDYSDATLERLWPDDPPPNIFPYPGEFEATLSKLLYCKRVRLEASEVELLQNNSETVGLVQPYVSYVFWEDDESMCLEEFESAFIPHNSSGKLRIATVLSAWFGIWLVLTVSPPN